MSSRYSLATLEAITKLKKLKPRLGDKKPTHRIEFARTAYKEGLIGDLRSYELFDDFGIGERDLDSCFEMNDSNVVVHALMKEAQSEPELESNIKAHEDWARWMAIYKSEEKQADLFS